MDVLYPIAKQNIVRNNTIYIILFYSVYVFTYAICKVNVNIPGTRFGLKDSNTTKQTKEPKDIKTIRVIYIQFSC